MPFLPPHGAASLPVLVYLLYSSCFTGFGLLSFNRRNDSYMFKQQSSLIDPRSHSFYKPFLSAKRVETVILRSRGSESFMFRWLLVITRGHFLEGDEEPRGGSSSSFPAVGRVTQPRHSPGLPLGTRSPQQHHCRMHRAPGATSARSRNSSFSSPSFCCSFSPGV